MRSMRGAPVLAITVATLILTTVLAAQQRGAPPAQPQAPQRMLVQITQVKPEMVETYEDLIKNQLLPAQKKGGVAFRFTMTNAPLGGPAFTYIALTPVTTYAQFDAGSPAQRAMGSAAWTAYQAKLRPTIVSQESFVQTLRTDLSIISGAPTPAPLAQVQVLQIAPGKGEEFTRMMTADFLPNYKKAGVKDFLVWAISFGDAPQGRIVTVRGLSKYADLDGTGLLQRAGLTPEAAGQLNARRAALATGISNVVERFRPELSFGTTATRSPSQ